MVERLDGVLGKKCFDLVGPHGLALLLHPRVHVNDFLPFIGLKVDLFELLVFLAHV